MITKKYQMLLSITIWFLDTASSTYVKHENHSTNRSYVSETFDLNSIASVFSPRMDFDQWKPLTGRGDPLRNDPTYDYEPPVLEKVHYWADENIQHREKHPERKSEVLMLGISSRKPSAVSRPMPPVKRHPKPPTFPPKYEDFSYKFSDRYPMTILVPPPPPPPNHQHQLFIVSEEKILPPTPTPQLPERSLIPKQTTTPEILTSFALQESNLIYQSSTTKENWLHEFNKTTSLPNSTVSSDYAGWGPTTPYDDFNEGHNLIPHTDYHNIEFSKEPLSYYKPILSESPPPPPPQAPPHLITVPSFLPTILPPTLSTADESMPSSFTEITQEMTTENQNYYTETTTEKIRPQPSQFSAKFTQKPSIIEMLGPMITMPIAEPDRPEDNLYAHASNNIHIFKEPSTEDPIKLVKMQTMQPPPPVKNLESSPSPSRQQFHVNPHTLNNQLHEKPLPYTQDPYLHMRYTTPTTTTLKTTQDYKTTTEASIPSYLIIQGHSKVKTYGSKPKPNAGVNKNEIQNPNETNEVKHLHPIKEKQMKQLSDIGTNRIGRAQSLKTLVENGLGSIEIQEADVGIKYDVSDGSGVPIEIYRKGIVDNEESSYYKKNKTKPQKKRQIDLDNLFGLREESLEDKYGTERNDTRLTDLLGGISNNSESIENDEG